MKPIIQDLKKIRERITKHRMPNYFAIALDQAIDFIEKQEPSEIRIIRPYYKKIKN